MDIALRTMAPDELRRFLEVTEASFGESLPDEVFEDLKHVIDPARSVGAFDGDKMVGTASAYSLRFTVPGGEVPGAGVSMVGVLPTHRRRGVMTKMMTAQLAEIRERGEPIATLWASEDTIYGRFGYGTATVQALIDIPRHRTQFVDGSPISGNFRLVDVEEAAKTFPAVYDTVRGRIPGMFGRSEAWWRHRNLRQPAKDEGPIFRVLLEHDGEPAGYAVYHVNPKWEKGFSGATVDVREAMAVSTRAQLDVWKFVFGIDLVESIRTTSFFLPVDHPLQLMLAQPRHLKFMLSNGLWVRILDVAAALEARTYSADGLLTIGIRDPIFDDVTGAWQMEVSGGRARVEKTAGDPDLSLGIAELGCVYLGQFTFARLAAAGRIEGAAGDVARADEMWRTDVTPWCPEIF
ncbi:MAG: GNAT family N-acetyltransferase [Actinomycetota bacterium]|nr:GNAT family N-acetyltransferase [Actinomycetota bacterium]